MGRNFISGCSRCKEKLFHFRGEEAEGMHQFYRRHAACMKACPSYLGTLDQELQERPWMSDGSYRDVTKEELPVKIELTEEEIEEEGGKHRALRDPRPLHEVFGHARGEEVDSGDLEEIEEGEPGDLVEEALGLFKSSNKYTSASFQGITGVRIKLKIPATISAEFNDNGEVICTIDNEGAK